MHFDDSAIEQAAEMTASLVDGEGLLFALDVGDVEAVKQLLVMIMLGAAPHRFASGLALTFFLVPPAALGVNVEPGDTSLALVGPGLASTEEVIGDLGRAPDATVLAGVILAGEQERLQGIAVAAGFTVGFVAATPLKLYPFSPDDDNEVVLAMNQAVGRVTI